MIRLCLVMVAAAAAPAWCTESRADDAPPGAASCSGCHPPSASVGISVPPLAGRKAADIAAAMAAFTAGTRPSTIMSRLSRGFSAEEIAAIARWYEKQRP